MTPSGPEWASWSYLRVNFSANFFFGKVQIKLDRLVLVFNCRTFMSALKPGQRLHSPSH